MILTVAVFLITVGWLAVFALIAALTVTVASPPGEAGDSPPPPLATVIIVTFATAGNALVFWLLHYLFYASWNPFVTMQSLLDGRISYQKLYYEAVQLAIRILCALLLGTGAASLLRSLHPGGERPLSPRVRQLVKRRLLLPGSALLLVMTGLLWFCGSGLRQLRLTEICPKNTSELAENGYVELQSEGILPCEASGLRLEWGNDATERFVLPDFTVNPGETVMIPLSETRLSLARGGGDVVSLYDSGGRLLDRIAVREERQDGCAYCRSGSDGKWYYMPPSPGESNRDSALVLKKPRFSHTAGFYDTPFDVTISADFLPEGGEIRYTTDGSKPTAASALYDGAVRVYDRSAEPNKWRAIRNIVYDWKNASFDDTPVRKAFVLRAVAIDRDGVTSGEATATYFVGQPADAGRMVVSVVADEDDLFGDDGIYVTGRTYDRWYLGDQKDERPLANFDVHGTECPASVEFFQDGQTLYFAQRAGLRIQGGSTRWLPLKRLSLFARKAYAGSNTFDRELFDGKRSHSVTLRAGFENAFSMYCVPDRDVAVQLGRPVTVYLNGEFWYDTYLQEKYNNTYFRQTYGVRDAEFYKTGINSEIRNYLENHDLSIINHYETFGRMVDIQSYIDYICTNVYLANTDYSEYANAGIWRTVYKENDGVGDGRWRWCLYDMDLQTEGCRLNYGMTDITDAQLDSFRIVCDWDPPVNERLIYKSLKANPDFCRQFVLSFMDIMNTDFTVERMTSLLEEWGEDISYHEYFFRDRPGNMEVFLAREFGLKSKPVPLTVTVSDEAAGSVTVNTCRPDLRDGAWTGRYFPDYPVTVTAQANPGYVFEGWTGAVTSDAETVEISLKGGAAIHAVFRQA